FPSAVLSLARARTPGDRGIEGKSAQAEFRERLPGDRGVARVLSFRRKREAAARQRGRKSFLPAPLETAAEGPERRRNREAAGSGGAGDATNPLRPGCAGTRLCLGPAAGGASRPAARTIAPRRRIRERDRQGQQGAGGAGGTQGGDRNIALPGGGPAEAGDAAFDGGGISDASRDRVCARHDVVADQTSCAARRDWAQHHSAHV